ncbi:DUF1707 domain-containing protein [Corynebacterium sp. CCUG 65737]|nr:DUF1707 domain-containing protein [Corynebacterium sp. CCUG 70398]MCQ4627707.1 DUF1707 domain-containing protein [Corynebacterium sp. CCUG 65737]
MRKLSKEDEMAESHEAPNVRVGDTERSTALDRLGEHFANGYLTPAEFEERSGQAAAARTRGEISALFTDLPEVSEGPAPAPAHRDSDAELENMIARKRKLDSALAVLWAATMTMFFLGMFVFSWDYFWVVLPVAGVLTAGLYTFYGISDEDDEVLEEIMEDANKERAERLRLAHQRRKELGK